MSSGEDISETKAGVPARPLRFRHLRRKPYAPQGEPYTGKRPWHNGFLSQLRELVTEELEFGRAFLFAPLLLAAGAVWWFARPQAPPVWGLALYAAISVFIALRFRHRGAVLRLTAAVPALFLAGALLAHFETSRLNTVMLDTPVTTHVHGTVESREQTSNGWRYVVHVLKTDDPVIHRPPERVTLVARGRGDAVPIGRRIKGLARLSPPSGPALPGLVDFAFLSYFDGIGAVGFFYGRPSEVTENINRQAVNESNLPEQLSERFDLAVESLRDTIAGKIRAVLPGENGAFANAIITGQRRAMDDDTLEALRNAGLAHVIAISGLHMALAAGIFYASVRFMLAFSSRAAEAVATKKIAALAALAAAFFYLLISGGQVSAERAFLMLAIMLLAAVFDRPAISLRNVAIAAFAILAISPSEITGPGMQMSFAATAALIAGYSVWQKRPRRDGVQGGKRALISLPFLMAGGILLTAIIGGFSTMPFAMAHFQRVAAYGLLGNLLAMPIVTLVVMPAGLLSMLAMPLGLHAPFLVVMGWGLDGVTMAANWVSQLGGAVTTGMVPGLFLPLFAAGFAPLVLMRTRLRLFGLMPVVLAVVLLAFSGDRKTEQLLISEDGTVLALVSGHDAALNKTRPSAFILDQWKSALKLDSETPPEKDDGTELSFAAKDRFERLTREEMQEARLALEETIQQSRRKSGHFLCRKNLWCVASFAGNAVTIVQVQRPALAGAACDNADIVVSTYRPGFQNCRSGALLMTPKKRRQTGSLIIEAKALLPREVLHPKDVVANVQTGKEESNTCLPVLLNIRTAFVSQDRKWRRHRLYNWRTSSFEEPMAIPVTLTISGNGESGRPACPEP